jgi:hypothetical protein
MDNVVDATPNSNQSCANEGYTSSWFISNETNVMWWLLGKNVQQRFSSFFVTHAYCLQIIQTQCQFALHNTLCIVNVSSCDEQCEFLKFHWKHDLHGVW